MQFSRGTFVGRIWREDLQGPSVVTIRNGHVIDITSKQAPTMRDLLEMREPAEFAATAAGCDMGDLQALANSDFSLLAPLDLQAIKACGVTFAQSMIERVVEERAAGLPSEAARIRSTIAEIVGGSLRFLRAGSEEAGRLKELLVREGVWSQYLEVGIGPDAEIFTKAPVLSAVGHNAKIGILASSRWNNPEPEIVLAIDSRGKIKGATLGNDVNLRDIEGRSALLLGKAKDNNASCSIGPFIRLFDSTFCIDDVRSAELTLEVRGPDGYVLNGRSSMKEISRDPLDLVSQTIGPHHQYPDGLMLFLGTLFAPVEDREHSGEGFTHKVGDVVSISCEGLGQLRNTVGLSTDCEPWTFGIAELMRNLAARELI
ncbi:fumarylacetoacetate hydrolase [Mesorhizobium sp. M7A.F.Ca.US.006.01.1.1]|uniref:fumarylacetoacetate hydrolase family protein n=1 Tax=Mesorhizobium sp. M7A.F.Ca.US.006.01.1.1 TaxID=2496707 RepID=UPI000FC9ECDA|nr:fumarylacetoacetate hydrolase family protein [Mesorhizobium sp. M7A.F.Ca.US.006.01.1.1]RUZ76010.1 fumarylacetoacetate hydrolase [Mesorhizobium sp. M7A.F.Ca.US.006.01.1.1]